MATFSSEAKEAASEALVDRALAGESIEIQSPSGGRVKIAPLSPEQEARLAGAPID